MDSISLPMKRLRAGQACVNCQIRKCRCDGSQPCSRCKSSGHDCSYRELPPSKSKMDIILDAIKNVEAKVEAIRDDNKFMATDNYASKIGGGIAPNHTTSTERILSWHVLNGIPYLKERLPCFAVEYDRPPFSFFAENINSYGSGLQKNERSGPYINDKLSMVLWDAFNRNVNFWFPVLCQSMVQKLQATIKEAHDVSDRSPGTVFDGPMNCLAWLVLALGSCCLSSEKRFQSYPYSPSLDIDRAEAVGPLCFNAAYALIPTALSEDTVISTLCCFYMAIYMSYLQRPLQVLSYLNSAAFKCQTLLRYQSTVRSNEESIEALRRVFYACFIIESDLDVELNQVPQSGCGDMQAKVPLPGYLDSHEDDEIRKMATIYFLACISMRRLMNRAHTLTGSDEVLTGDGVNMKLVAELEYQLERWRDVLPSYLKFSLDTEEADNVHQGHLRQRFFACKSVIFRPVFNYVILNDMEGTSIGDFSLVEEAVKCIWASYLHMANLRGLIHGVITDAWICSLAMEGCMIILLLAKRSSLLSPFMKGHLAIPLVCEKAMDAEITLTKWMENAPEQSPTLRQSIELIRHIHKALSYND